jgi:hypothetical protein
MKVALAPAPRLVSNLVWKKHVWSTVLMASMAAMVCCGLLMLVDHRGSPTMLSAKGFSSLRSVGGISDFGINAGRMGDLPPSIRRAAERYFQEGFKDGEILAENAGTNLPEIPGPGLQDFVRSNYHANNMQRQNALAHATSWSPDDAGRIQREIALAHLMKKAWPSQEDAGPRIQDEEQPTWREYVFKPADISVRSRSYSLPELAQLEMQLEEKHAEDKGRAVKLETDAHKVRLCLVDLFTTWEMYASCPLYMCVCLYVCAGDTEACMWLKNTTVQNLVARVKFQRSFRSA